MTQVHTVVFKCVGVTKNTDSQSALRTARQRIQTESYPVKLVPEPTNIKDSKVIVKLVADGYVQDMLSQKFLMRFMLLYKIIVY